MINNIKELEIHPTLMEMEEVFNAYPTNYLCKYDFEQYGITSTPQFIARLKAEGAIIETIYRTKIDNYGKSHNRIACYRIVGWVQ